MLSQITPVILTYNEAANLERSLSHLGWAEDIVVVDSGSQDATAEIARSHDRVRWFERPFDAQAGQWRYAITETDIKTPWVLRLDADYLVPKALSEEIAGLAPQDEVSAYRIGFDYAVQGRRLLASLYPANTVLFRKEQAEAYERGHTEAWRIHGEVRNLRQRLVHDDRKSLDRWFATQLRYMSLEQSRLAERGRQDLRPTDRLRRLPLVIPFLGFFYCLFGKGLILNGRAGLHYATQRLIAEAILSLMLLDERLRRGP